MTLLTIALTVISVALLIACVWITLCRRKDRKSLSSSPDRNICRTGTRPNAIYVFGDFLVTDRNGNDITDLFTPQQKTILYLLLESAGEGGISSKRLSGILWPDKEEDKVKNSRGVAINHLRKSLSNIDGISLVFREGRYTLFFGEPFYCDYTVFLNLTGKGSIDADKLISIMSRGRFMKSNTDPTFDTFKENAGKRITDLLEKEIRGVNSRKEWMAVCRIARMMAENDPLDEKAMKLQICAMKKMKMPEEALAVYERFTDGYRKSFGTEYGTPFNNI